MADILITPASSLMAFTSSLNYKQTLTQEASGSLTLLGSGSTGRTDVFTVNGNNGTLFSISDYLSNSLFSVNTIAGLPVIEAFADNTVVMGQYGQNILVVTGSNVGIGTATPGAKLDVNGASLFQGEQSIYYTNATQTMVGSTGYSLFRMYGNSNGVEMQVDAHSSNSGAATIGTFSNSNLYIKTNNANRIIVTNGGNVGIGTTSPATKLDVNGGIKASTIQLTSGASDGYVLTSDSSGNGSWQAASGGGGGGIHILTKPVTNLKYGQFITGVQSYTYGNGGTNLIILAPFIPANDIRIQDLSIEVAQSFSGGLVQILVYSADANGLPDTKLIQSTNLDVSTSGTKTYISNYTFTAGTTYWIGLHTNQSKVGVTIYDGSQIMPIDATNAFIPNTTRTTSAYTFGSAPTTISGTTTGFNNPFVVLLKSA